MKTVTYVGTATTIDGVYQAAALGVASSLVFTKLAASVCRRSNVRFGSKAAIGLTDAECPLCAKSGHWIGLI